MPAHRKPLALQARQRPPKNAKILPRVNPRRAPRLPAHPDGGEWKSQTRLFWRDLWHSPESTTFERHHFASLLILAMLIDQFFTNPTASLAHEIRCWAEEFGLTPDSRRGLEWFIEEPQEELEISVGRPERKNGHGDDIDPGKILEGDPRDVLKNDYPSNN